LIRHFLPAGLNHIVKWQKRFKAVGFDRGRALRAALSGPMRRALVDSRIEHLPREFLNHLDLVVDIGANEGQWASAFLSFATVHRLEAFEPNPEVFAVLKNRFANRPNTHLHNLALGDSHTTIDLNVTQGSGLSSMLMPTEMVRREYAPAAEIIKQIPVQVVPLDDLLDDGARIDLMKIDVQGFEHPVLRGATKCLSRTRALLIETNFASHYSGDGSFGTLFNHLNELGFDFWDISAPYRGSAGQALWADSVFLNRALTAAR
jgi:FkbM family methyltransferase